MDSGIAGRFASWRDRQCFDPALCCGARAGRSCDSGAQCLPGQHEPRDPHADERRDRHDRSAARHRADAEQRDYSTRSRLGESLLAIINDILDFSKIEAGKLELEPHPFEFDHLVSDTLELLSAQAEANGVELAIDYPAEVRRSVIGDAGRVRQVITNLVGNAIKFTHEGHVLVRIRAHGEQQLRLEVQDTGIGIPADTCKRLMQPFTQANAETTRKYGGTRPRLGDQQTTRRVDGWNRARCVRQKAKARPSALRCRCLPPKTRRARLRDSKTCKACGFLLVDDLAVNRQVYGEHNARLGHSL